MPVAQTEMHNALNTLECSSKVLYNFAHPGKVSDCLATDDRRLVAAEPWLQARRLWIYSCLQHLPDNEPPHVHGPRRCDMPELPVRGSLGLGGKSGILSIVSSVDLQLGPPDLPTAESLTQ